ncbi:MAG: DUF3175 domain-containing protein [Sphingobium sp.]|nr:DUF3175 domain-containing protein [Sphingobium sp.]
MPHKRKWSQDVTEHSNALDLERDVFKGHDPREIAQSLKRSAEASGRRKATPFRSAMSMLTFYINRAGDGLDDEQRRILERAKEELRQLFNKPHKD